jgi:aminoglycoside phosphotransferase (APT) family kinase protein
VPAARVDALVERDEHPLADWRDEAAECFERVGAAIPAPYHRQVERFLADPAPARGQQPVLSHNDLGAEHVLVRPGLRVTGVVDWSDAALTDPARDLGLVLRDLGPGAFRAAVEARRAAGWPPDDGLAARARFLAGCALLEDLAYGLEPGVEQDRTRYVRNGLAALPWVFGPVTPGR